MSRGSLKNIAYVGIAVSILLVAIESIRNMDATSKSQLKDAAEKGRLAERLDRNRNTLERMNLRERDLYAKISSEGDKIASAGVVFGVRYKVIDFNPETAQITLRNPEGRNPTFYHDGDRDYFLGKNRDGNRDHENDGIFQVDLKVFTRIFELELK